MTIQAVMQGWMAAIREEETAAATLAAARGARTLVLASSAVLRYDTLPVVSVASGGEERFVVRRDDARSLFERTMPWALLGDEPRPRVEILNGTGEVGVTQSVAKAVVREGVEVTLTGNLPGFGADTTQVLYYRDEGAATAEALAAALGIGVVVKAPRPVDVIDVTIVVGADLATGQDRDQGPDQE
ncbi:MAG: LytR C-terminal domain-containing protein [Acidimicrobiia bacterium]|nr:LytR C-terminal domain-containing protein [Acidimicrobiia bacterium]